MLLKWIGTCDEYINEYGILTMRGTVSHSFSV